MEIQQEKLFQNQDQWLYLIEKFSSTHTNKNFDFTTYEYGTIITILVFCRVERSDTEMHQLQSSLLIVKSC